MDVTRENFDVVLPEFKNVVEKATFISLDTELTGLIEGSRDDFYDTPSGRYQRYLYCSMNYLVTQLGVCAWVWQSDVQRYACHSYNFYVFPHSREGSSVVNFHVDSSAVDFLVKNKFDFNKTFYQGIPYLRRDEYNELMKELDEKYASKIKLIEAPETEQKEPVRIPPEKESFVNDVVAEFTSFMEKCLSLPSSETMDVTDESVAVDTSLVQSDNVLAPPTLSLSEKYNSFERKLVYDHLLLRCPDWKDCVSMKTCNNADNKPHIVITYLGKFDKIKRKEILLESYKEKKEKLQKLLGVTQVLELIAKRADDVVIVLHHGILDAMHLIHHFMTPLPNDYSSFKLLCLTYFGRIVDTKHVASQETFAEFIQNSSLASLIASLSEKITPPTIDFPEGTVNFLAPEASEKFHDAAFDAFVTGRCFLIMLHYLETSKNISHDPNTMHHHISSYLNKFHLFKSNLFAFYDLLRDEPQDESLLQRIFLCEIPSDWTYTNIEGALKPFSPPEERINVFWINSTSAWIRIQKSESFDINAVLALSLEECGFRLCPFAKVALAPPHFTPSIPPAAEKKNVNNQETQKLVASVQNTSTNGADAASGDDEWKVASRKRRRRC